MKTSHMVLLSALAMALAWQWVLPRTENRRAIPVEGRVIDSTPCLKRYNDIVFIQDRGRTLIGVPQCGATIRFGPCASKSENYHTLYAGETFVWEERTLDSPAFCVLGMSDTEPRRLR